VVRASIAAEKAGVPTVPIVSTAFSGQAQTIAQALGARSLTIAEYPGVIMTESQQELRRKTEEVLVNKIVEGLCTPVEDAIRDIIFRGTLAEVNKVFNQKLWADGLPIIPPTIAKVEEFLRFTEHSPEEVMGVLMPENREATVWNIAVNGVMAGCRPEYMPLLIAVVEAIADPEFRIQDSGSTPGWEPLIILNGPVIKELDFNCESGVMRVGRQANTSIGRFIRLYMRNVAGLRIPPGTTDKASIGLTFNVVLAENEDAVAALGWEPFSVDQGFKRGENVVTVQSAVAASIPTYSGGDSPLDHLETIAEVIGRGTFAYWSYIGAHLGKFYPLLVMSPSVAKVIAKEGWTKNDIRKYLYDSVKIQAGLLEKLAWQGGISGFNLCDSVEKGTISEEYCQSKDPDRMVPVFLRADWIGIVISGDPGRNQSKGYVQNQVQGPPISKKIMLPANWEPLLKEARNK
jgi:hypothetical protein